METKYTDLPMGISPSAWRATLKELDDLRKRADGLAEECRKSRAILGPFGMLRVGIIQEDGLMYEDARRATDAAGWLKEAP